MLYASGAIRQSANNSSLMINYIAVDNDVHGFFHGMKEERNSGKQIK
jgi:hypothetical protein